MGMAASQARLLTITARLADNELRSQTINNAKMRLSAQSSQASEKYINALNNARLQFSNYDASGDTVSQDLTYNALTAYSSYNTQYGLVNSANQILVSESEAAIFKAANGNLDAYLKAHGLEYTTTYFDEIGAIQNSNYPDPFYNISVENMKSWYESYNSYENSLEVQEFTKLQSDYKVASNNLLDACEDSFISALTFDNTTFWITYGSPLKQDNDDQIIHGGVSSTKSIEANLEVIRRDLNDSNNFYSAEKLRELNFISEDVKNAANALLSADNLFAQKFPSGNTYLAVKEDVESWNLTPTTDESGNKIYEIDGVKYTVNASGYVTAVDTTALAESYTIDTKYDDGQVRDYMTATVRLIETPDGTKNLKDYLAANRFIVECNEGTNTETFRLQYGINDNGDEPYKYVYLDQTQAADTINGVVANYYDLILQNVNYENFAEWLLANKDETYNINGVEIPSLLWNYGINLNKVTPCGDNLETVLNTYVESKSAFLNAIFDLDSANEVSTLINNNETFVLDTGETILINADSLMDVDFVLQLIANSEQQFGLSLNAAESYNTIVKEHLMDELIELYGTPKYAWVDENDTANTGNADAKAQWYTNLFNRMQRGYKTLENGLASSKEWIEYALEAGIVSLEQVDKSFNWKGLDFRTCTKIIEVTDDAAVTAAEAEYNRAMNDIKAKDNIYDLELKNIDTEHTALQTEYDVIKGVIDKNISRTLKFNQSA